MSPPAKSEAKRRRMGPYAVEIKRKMYYDMKINAAGRFAGKWIWEAERWQRLKNGTP